MREIRCLIIDDEPLAHRVIENYVKDFSFIRIVGKCRNGLEALELLKLETVDLIFLDIQMPKLNGLRFLGLVPEPPVVILTTAYHDYALESYEFEVADYLLKPFSFERFWKALEKGHAQFELRKKQKASLEHPEIDEEILSPEEKETFMFIRSEGKAIRIDFDDLILIEAMGDYVKLILKHTEWVSHQSLRQIEERLPKELFERIHRSYIVATGKIDTIETNEIRIGKRNIPIGNAYRSSLMARIKL